MVSPPQRAPAHPSQKQQNTSKSSDNSNLLILTSFACLIRETVFMNLATFHLLPEAVTRTTETTPTRAVGTTGISTGEFVVGCNALHSCHKSFLQLNFILPS